MKTTPTAPPKPEPVSFADVATMAMAAGNESKLTKVIHNDHLMQWVGIGWIELGQATYADELKYPEVIEGVPSLKERASENKNTPGSQNTPVKLMANSRKTKLIVCAYKPQGEEHPVLLVQSERPPNRKPGDYVSPVVRRGEPAYQDLLAVCGDNPKWLYGQTPSKLR